jgi:RNA polymerase sigma factor (sigma-70 family)
MKRATSISAKHALWSDARLLGEASRDPDAFGVVYTRYAERVARFFLQRTGDRSTSLDLTAETFARAWLSVDRFRDLAGGSAGPWLFGIARNVLYASVATGRMERKACDRLGLEVPYESQTEPSEAWLEGLDEALEALPARQREAVKLRIVDDLSYADTAAALGCSPTAARIRVSRALSTLRNALEGGHQ